MSRLGQIKPYIKENTYKISSKNKMLRHSAFIAVYNLTVTNGSSITKKIPTPGPKWVWDRIKKVLFMFNKQCILQTNIYFPRKLGGIYGHLNPNVSNIQ